MRLSDASRRPDAQRSDIERLSDRKRRAELKRWAESRNLQVRWYNDSSTGSDLSRPEWDRLMEDVDAEQVGTVVCWRLDELGKTCS